MEEISLLPGLHGLSHDGYQGSPGRAMLGSQPEMEGGGLGDAGRQPRPFPSPAKVTSISQLHYNGLNP